MVEKKTKSNAGRPKKKIDYKAAEQLASIMCTQEEIASMFDVSVRTLQRDAEFCRVYRKGLDKGKMSLRRKQFHMSDSNPAMAIWLGKQYLNQADVMRQDVNMNAEVKTDMTSSQLDEEIEKLESKLGIGKDE